MYAELLENLTTSNRAIFLPRQGFALHPTA